MKTNFLKIAGVDSEAEFYQMYPSEEAFFAAHPEAQMMQTMKSGGNAPTNPALWSRAKAAARAKYDVYPSAYANGWAAKWYKSKGGGWRKAEYGGMMADGGAPDNAGFNALPEFVQEKIMSNMAYGGTNNEGFKALPPYVQAKIMSNMASGGQMPAEIARARFAAAGNLDQMDDYGYANGGSTYSGGVWFDEGGIPMMQFAGATPPNDDEWIRKMLQFEATKGSASGTGLSNWGYNSPRGFKKDSATGLYKNAQGQLYNGTGQWSAPKTMDEAVAQYKKEYLPEVANQAPGLRERQGDFLYNTGEDARLYQLDQYVRQYENMPNGLQDRGQYRSTGAKAGEFGKLYGQYQSKIDALPLEQRVKLMDDGRDYYYKNINTVNGQPSAAYNATWKPRVSLFGQYQAPQAQTAAPAVKATAPVQQAPRAQYQIQTAPTQTIQPFPVNGFAQPKIAALPGVPSIGPNSAAQQAQAATPVPIQPTSPIGNYKPADLAPAYSLDDMQADIPAGGIINQNTGVAAADAMIQNQFQQQAASTYAKPVGNMPKPKPDMNNFNKGLMKAQDKMMSDWADPYSLEGMTGLANNIVEGVNNRKDLNANLAKQRYNYSTDGMYNENTPSAMNRGQYDMYGMMAPANQSGMMSFTGMNQKYTANRRFDIGGSPYESMATSWIPGDVKVPDVPFLVKAPAAPMASDSRAMTTAPAADEVTRVNFNLDGNFEKYAQDAQSYLDKKAPGTQLKGVDLAVAAQAAYKKNGTLVPVQLALAQLQIEGYLAKGNKPNKPQRTNNPFNVGNTDNGDVVQHNSIQSGVNAYYDLVSRSYLKDKTPEQLLQNFVNKSGNRYASDKSYERKLRSTIGNMKFAYGGEVELTQDEIDEILRNGGEVEYI